jgi:serine kinase of HPr protein (carbohydrate metabolism regulator)
LHGATELVHGTCVALGGRAALLRGPPGSGKSDLALRFLFQEMRASAGRHACALVADDQVQLERLGSRLVARAPAAIRGKIEVRGLGILEVGALTEAELVLAVDLVPAAEVERMPEEDTTVELLGVAVSYLRLAPFEASAPIKLALALGRATPPDLP